MPFHEDSGGTIHFTIDPEDNLLDGEPHSFPIPELCSVSGKFKKPFQSQEVGLTYARCPLTKEDLLSKLMELNNYPELYHIVREKHKERPEDTPTTCMWHLHVWMRLKKRPKIWNPRYFDVLGLPWEGSSLTVYHPSFGKKNRGWINHYLRKEDKDPLTNMGADYVGLAVQGKADEARAAFIKQHPKEYMISRLKVEQSIKALGKRKRPPEDYRPLTSFDQNMLSLDIADWDKNKCLVLRGRPNTGKTSFAKSLLASLGLSFMFISHLDKLKDYDGEDALLFDDMEFGHLPRATQIALLDVECDRSVHCRHRTAEIPHGTIRVFVSNWVGVDHNHQEYDICLFVDDLALNRRQWRCNVVGDLRVT